VPAPAGLHQLLLLILLLILLLLLLLLMMMMMMHRPCHGLGHGLDLELDHGHHLQLHPAGPHHHVQGQQLLLPLVVVGRLLVLRCHTD
jgi:hypothetical protein